MRNKMGLLLFLVMAYVFLFIVNACSAHSQKEENKETEIDQLEAKETLEKEVPIKIDGSAQIAQQLIEAYPDRIIGYQDNHIIWYDSTLMLIDDGILSKAFDVLMNQPDIEDLFHFKYIQGPDFPIPIKNYDPGRIRHDDFFKKMYGASKKEVQKNLVPIRWLPSHANQKIWVSKINGIAEKMQAISNELDQMADLYKYLENPGGTFNWRFIAGTKRQSMHSYGASIDINTKYANYWKWDLKSKKTETLSFENKIPWAIVAVFEKYGFVWGGKWYHYDSMHFEYRPELFLD